ncbi:hypothetical protein G6045_05795 [Streptomyces sp. YC504]|uniref:Uncharacterized protein n=1 Tax=Streptomyces mesophilus TaxID=1775132 RepID=A0A6G4XCS8_9ACTN|nr:hypothetical protein [Streptomyces mesophilus]NGO75198.1 hypothetical protein [Streptomyces mesophilus]
MDMVTTLTTSAPALDQPCGIAGASRSTFRLSDLLMECLTHPRISWEDEDSWGRVEGFDSTVLQRRVTPGTVLSLAGLLALEGPDAELSVESADNHGVTLVTERQLRIRLTPPWGGVGVLCAEPHCSDPMIERGTIDLCHTHLAASHPDTIAAMAQSWATQAYCVLEGDPARLGGSRQAELLVAAAATQGASDRVISTLLESLFVEENMIEEQIWDETEQLEMRYATGKERIRLRTVADKEERRLRGVTKHCLGCGDPLHEYLRPVRACPPQYCSPACADKHRPKPKQPDLGDCPF